jgi:hypothetical protein
VEKKSFKKENEKEKKKKKNCWYSTNSYMLPYVYIFLELNEICDNDDDHDDDNIDECGLGWKETEHEKRVKNLLKNTRCVANVSYRHCWWEDSGKNAWETFHKHLERNHTQKSFWDCKLKISCVERDSKYFLRDLNILISLLFFPTTLPTRYTFPTLFILNILSYLKRFFMGRCGVIVTLGD